MVAVKCRRCSQPPKVERGEDPAILEKRYSVKCGNPECKCSKIMYGMTESLAIFEWNSYMDRVKPVNLGNIERRFAMN